MEHVGAGGHYCLYPDIAGTGLTGPVEIEGIARFPDDGVLCDKPLGWDTRLPKGRRQ